MYLDKFCLVDVDRTNGPQIVDQTGFSPDDEMNILLFALPTGEAIHESFKFIRIEELFYCSYVEVDESNNLQASVIGIPIGELQFNPFDLCPVLIEMIDARSLPQPIEGLEPNQHNLRVIKGFSHIVASLFILQRVIVVGDQTDIIDFFSTIYEGIPVEAIPELSCITYTNGLHNEHNLQGVPPDERLADDLQRVQTNSTIVILDQEEVFGLYSSPFTEEIEKLYLASDFSTSKRRIREFMQMATSEQIGSSSDFARKHGIPRADAKLMKTFQKRMARIDTSLTSAFGFRRLPE